MAHFLNNTILNLVQLQAPGGDLQPAIVLSVVVVIAMAVLAFAVNPISRRLALPRLTPWAS